MLYTQDLSDFDTITGNGFNENTQKIFTSFKEKYNAEKLPLVKSVFSSVDIPALKKFVAGRKKYKYVVLLGTGGSALGTYAVASWHGHFLKQNFNDDMPKFMSFDNFDPISHHDFFENIDLTECQFLAISKSGNTLETMSQAYLLAEDFEKKGLKDSMSDHITIITEPRDSAMTRYAQKYNLPTFEHHSEIGGRYSVLTMTGLLPLLFLGYNIEALLTGAKDAYNEFANAEKYTQSNLFLSAFVFAHFANQEPLKYHNHIAISYGDNFYGFSLWMRQLIAESLGKEGKGLLFVPAFGPVDQHSQLQLYSDGLDDKVYTVFTHNFAKKSITIHSGDKAFEYLTGKNNSDVKDALQNGTISSLRHLGRKIRQINIQDFSTETLGFMMMYMMLETIFIADMMKVDAFDQPAVEDSKIRAKKILLGK